MKAALKLGRSAMRTLTVRIEGVEVKVYVDAQGWPSAATTAFWHDDARERLHRIAMAHARALAVRTAEKNAKARSDQARTKKSTERKRARATAHFARKWLAAALKKQSDLGADRLALAARRLLAAHPGDPDYTARAQITEYRAKQYLQRRKKSGEM